MGNCPSPCFPEGSIIAHVVKDVNFLWHSSMTLDILALPFTAQELHQGSWYECYVQYRFTSSLLRGFCTLLDRLILLFLKMFLHCVGIKAVLTSKLALALDVHLEGRHWGALLWLAPRTSHGTAGYSRFGRSQRILMEPNLTPHQQENARKNGIYR